MVAKNGKKLINTKFKNLKVTTGTVDNKNPKSVYFTISGWASPKLDNDINYQNVIYFIEKDLKRILFSNINNEMFTPDRFIIDFDMRESGISYGRKSYMNCEITLYQKQKLKIQDETLQRSLNNLITIIIDEIFIKSKHFYFTKNKN